MQTGNKDLLNRLKGLSTAVVTNNEETAVSGLILKKGVQLYNSDTRELKVSDGNTPVGNLPDHRHKSLSPIGHTHMYGTNEPWLLTNPRLWYADDVQNHPELFVLDGSDLTDEEAQYLSMFYPGTKLLTEPVSHLGSEGFDNNYVTINGTWKGDFLVGRLFNEPIDQASLFQLTDQWLSSDSDLNTEQTISVTFKGDVSYEIREYWMIPAAGTSDALATKRPTPNSWVLEGHNGNESWEVIDSQSEITADQWQEFTIKIFKVAEENSLNEYKYLRLRITKWNAGAMDNLEVGLRRFWIFGKRSGIFSLPSIESPYDDFVYVIPNKNLNVGLKHEDVGDIGTSGCLPINLAPYRLPTDGRSELKSLRSILFSVIGHRYDKVLKPDSITPSSGMLETGITDKWTVELVSNTSASYVDFETTTPCMIGKYLISRGAYSTPASWVIEGYDTDWKTIQEVTDLPLEEFPEDGVFYIDTAVPDNGYTKFRINFLKWHNDGAQYGFNDFKIFTHEPGRFYLPNIVNEDGLTTYIVSDINAVDVSPEIIQRMQQNIITLTEQVASLSDQILKLNPDVDTSVK